MSRTRGKILVIRGGAIGDFVLTLPVLAALREHFPETHLAVLGYPHIAGLALAGDLVDEVRSIEARALAGFFANGGDLDPDLSGFFGQASIILSYLYDPDGIFQQNVARVSGAQFIAGPHRPDERLPLHAAETFLRPLERLAIFSAEATPKLLLPEPTAPKLGYGRWLAVHPGSGSARKNWPESRWAELLDRLMVETAWKALVIGGEAEEGRHRRLAAKLPAKRCELLDHRPLTEVAQWLRECHAYVGHDSGISHLAAAVGLPSVILWGDSVEHVWRPLGEHVRIVRAADGLEQTPVCEVFSALAAL
jgi:heptosyltransferase-2